MNAVEIEEAVSALIEAPFDAAEFPYAFLAAFGNKDATLKKLRSTKASETTNKSDVGGVLQRNNIHLAVAPAGAVSATLSALRESPATAKHKARFILATDGATVEAEHLESGEPLACAWADLPDHFGFFLPLAGITTVRQIRENAFDIRATSKLNKLYVELLKVNPEWGSDERRPDMNHFMSRLIFSFFAEDTGIMPAGLFSNTVSTMSAPDASNTHEVISELFRAMNTAHAARGTEDLPRWAASLPYVNGGLFAGNQDVPQFSRTARAYLLQVGSLDWKQINPDIFGSMIQAVADDDERGALGMHYTSVPNILKVLNPLFLDDLRTKLEEAGDNPRTLLNLRKRLARIRMFDPACGSGNFLVIAYKEMRAIEHEINRRRGETDRRSDIPLTNFRGIELRDFAAEIARLALIIAEFQCDELYRGQKEAIRDFLPLSAENWITCGNALRLDWLSVCPPTGTAVKLVGDDLFSTPLDQSEIDFENSGGETYICGNPPYLGSKWQSAEQKADLGTVFNTRASGWKSLDYVAGWFAKACDYGQHAEASTAFVSTNSICQGQQVAIMWPMVFGSGHVISFAHTSFSWANLASHNAGVTVVIVGLSRTVRRPKTLFSTSESGETVVREVPNINAYLVGADNVEVLPRSLPPDERAKMQFGNHPYYGGALIFSSAEGSRMASSDPRVARFMRPLYGAKEFIEARPRKCLWIHAEDADEAARIPAIQERMTAVAHSRLAAAQDKAAVALATTPYRFRDQFEAHSHVIVVPRVSSENRPQLPVGVLPAGSVIQDQAFALYDAPIWTIALIASRLHLVWIATVCGKMKTDFRYSNSLGWNTFPVPMLTEQNKADLMRCAEAILLAREAHYPASIAELYVVATMPTDLRDAHDRNDEVLERIYIGRRFRNDTERLEKLFSMYTKMTARQQPGTTARRGNS